MPYIEELVDNFLQTDGGHYHVPAPCLMEITVLHEKGNAHSSGTLKVVLIFKRFMRFCFHFLDVAYICFDKVVGICLCIHLSISCQFVSTSYRLLQLCWIIKLGMCAHLGKTVCCVLKVGHCGLYFDLN